MPFLFLLLLAGILVCLIVIAIDGNSARNHLVKQTALLERLTASQESSMLHAPGSKPKAPTPESLTRAAHHPALQPMRPPGRG